MQGLTSVQARVWHSTAALISQLGRSPTVREVASAADLSPSATYCNLVRLKARGWINWTEGRECTIRLTPRAPEAFHLPDALKARLEALCAQTGDDPLNVICDAIALHIDQAEAEFPLSQ
jgi:SOS-response transcriptional repressor LexA